MMVENLLLTSSYPFETGEILVSVLFFSPSVQGQQNAGKKSAGDLFLGHADIPGEDQAFPTLMFTVYVVSLPVTGSHAR